MNNQAHWGKPDFWKEINPECSISDKPFDKPLPDYPLEAGLGSRLREQLLQDGYFQAPPQVPLEDCEAVARCVSRVLGAGFPPVFAMVYDQPWQLLMRLMPFFLAVAGPDFSLIPDFWVWHVDGVWENSGWKPHRDSEVKKPFDALGSPELINIWIPFVNVSLENSCMHVLPTSEDPYLPEDQHLCSVKPGSEGSVRALPAQAGSVMGWSQLLLHWGSERPAHSAEPPRINVAIYLERNGFSGMKLPLISADQPLSLIERLGMVGGMVFKYQDYYPLAPEVLSGCKRFYAFWLALLKLQQPVRQG